MDTNQNNKKMKIILAAIAVAAIIAIILVVIFSGKSGRDKSVANTDTAGQNVTQLDEQSGEEITLQPSDTKIYTPNFMYFVSKKDANYNVYMAVIDELKTDYDGKVTFDIVDIDENPEAKENFPVTDETTPMLILTNIHNDITAMEFSCSDKDKLTADIKKALGN